MIIGKKARIYEIDKNKFLISIDEESEDKLSNWLDNSIEFVKVDKNLLEKAKALEIDISSILEERVRELINRFNQSHGRDLNPGPLPYQGNALPAELPWLDIIEDTLIKTLSIPKGLIDC